MDTKERFKDLLLNTFPKREGMGNLLEYLETKTDFFRAPASTKYHGAKAFGLLEHSIGVYEYMCKLVENGMYPYEILPDSLTIVSLLHDVCKANMYKVEMRNRKNDAGFWEKYPVYIIDEELPWGHGEKSVILLQQFLSLRKEEITAINWHMGGFDNRTGSYGGSMALSNAMNKYPLTALLHMADLAECYFNNKTE